MAQWLVTQGPRREGSSAEASLFDALARWFEPWVEVHRGDFAHLDGEHSFSQQLWFRVRGASPGELVVVAPTDGPNDQGLTWAVSWAWDALTRGTNVSVTFLFTGAERAPGTGSSLGSRTFLQDFYPTDPAAVVYLDARRADAVEITAESGLYSTPLWMVQDLSAAIDRQHLPVKFTGTAPSLFRLDLPERRNALEVWFERSIPGVLIVGGPSDPGLVRALAGFVASLPKGLPSEGDRHWLAFDLGWGPLFWNQQTYLTVYLGAVMVLVFGYALLGRRHRGTLKVLAQGFWQIPALLAYAFLALGAGTLAASALQMGRDQPDLWRQLPLLVWTFKALVAVTLYILLFLPRRSPLSRDPDFYSQAALLTLGAMTLGATAFELSFSFYFLWALVWASVGLVARFRWLKLFALVMGPLWLFKAASDVLGPQPDLELTRWVLASPVAGNFVLAVLFFPFLMQVTAWHFSGLRHQHRDEGLRATAQLLGWGLGTIVVGLLVLRWPATPIPELPTPQVVDLTGHPVPRLWNTEVTRSAFLDRTVWDLTFTGVQGPETLDLNLESTRSLTIFDCSFPLVFEPDGRRAHIVIGPSPPLPLEVRLTLPNTVTARLTVRGTFSGSHPWNLVDAVDLKP